MKILTLMKALCYYVVQRSKYICNIIGSRLELFSWFTAIQKQIRI